MPVCEQRDGLSAPRVGGWLFGAFLAGYLLLAGGHIYSPDGAVMLRVTQSLLEGRLDIEPLPSWPTHGGDFTLDSETGERRFYAKYGLGMPLAAAPTVLLGRLLLPAASASDRSVFDTPFGPPVAGRTPTERDPFGGGNPFRLRWEDWSAAAWPAPFESFAAAWTNALILAAALVALFGLARELGYDVRTSAAVAVLAGVATPLSHYAKTFFAEPLAALGLTLFVLLTLRSARHPDAGARHPGRAGRALFGAGLALGICVLAKVAHAVLLPAGVGFVCLVLWRRGRFRVVRDTGESAAGFGSAGTSERLRALASFAAGLALPLLLIAYYNQVRFGSPFETGYGAEVAQWTTPFAEGLFGLLLSPGRGLFVYAPILLASLWAAPRFARRFPLEAGFVAVALAVLLVTYARWHMWEGGWCFGPRFLVPLLPLLVLPCAELLQALQRLPRKSVGRAVFAALALCSVLCASTLLWVNFVDFHNWVKLSYEFRAAEYAAAGIDGYYDLVRWDWGYSPLLASLRFPIHDAFLLPHALRAPGLVLALQGLFALAGVVSLAGLRRALWQSPPARASELSGSEALASP